MSEKLLPCPFCGGQPLLTTHGNEYTRNRGTEIKCSDCIVIRKTYAIKHSLGWTIDKAIELWNRRAPAPASDGPGPSSTAYPIPAPGEHKIKPPGYVTFAELDEMSMKPEVRT